MELPYSAYGQQLTLDGYNASSKQCNDVAQLYDFLMHLPEKIGMTRVGFPHIIKIDTPGIVGLSGFVFIMESHISVHTYTERNFITVDVYSCKKFDEFTVARHITEHFDCSNFEQNVLVRGARFNNVSVEK